MEQESGPDVLNLWANTRMRRTDLNYLGPDEKRTSLARFKYFLFLVLGNQIRGTFRTVGRIIS